MKFFGWNISVEVSRIPRSEVPETSHEVLEQAAREMADDVIEALEEAGPGQAVLIKRGYGISCRADVRGEEGNARITSRHAPLLMRIRELMEARGCRPLADLNDLNGEIVFGLSK